MSTARLRFDDYNFTCNPESLSVTKAYKSGSFTTLVSASGELFGESAAQNAGRLTELFEKKTVSSLYIPETGVIKAYISGFDYSLGTAPNVISYTLTFTKCEETKREEYALYTVLQNGETLFSVARLLKCDVNTLFRLNSGKIKSYAFYSGDKVIVPLFTKEGDADDSAQ